MRGRRADINTDAGEMRVWTDEDFVVVAVMWMAMHKKDCFNGVMEYWSVAIGKNASLHDSSFLSSFRSSLLETS